MKYSFKSENLIQTKFIFKNEFSIPWTNGATKFTITSINTSRIFEMFLAIICISEHFTATITFITTKMLYKKGLDFVNLHFIIILN